VKTAPLVLRRIAHSGDHATGWEAMDGSESSVDRAYAELRRRAINFEFKPGERLNESALSGAIDVSRTPLREALNRLVAEGFLTLAPGKGFFCRPLSPEKIAELYQLRCAVESEAAIRAVEHASSDAIAAFAADFDAAEPLYLTSRDPSDLLSMDEDFHMTLAALSGNAELARVLCNVNERIRYVRIISLRAPAMEQDAASASGAPLSSHRAIVSAIAARDAERAVFVLRNHIEMRSEQAVELVRAAYSQLYVPHAS